MTNRQSDRYSAVNNDQNSEQLEIYTIGHSNMKPYELIRLLALNRIDTVVDVRSIPYSRTVPWFNKSELERVLEESGIGYRFGGKYLGAYPDGRKPAKDYSIDWGELSRREEYKEGIRRLLELGSDRRIAIICAEENPYRCHRHHLISQTLIKRGVSVKHIRRSGPLESATESQQKLF